MTVQCLGDGRWRAIYRDSNGNRRSRLFFSRREALAWARIPYRYRVWIGDGSGPAHYVGQITDDNTACGQPNHGISWLWDYPRPDDPVCPTCQAKAAGL